MMRVLITGANGFVGAELRKALITKGHAVKSAVRTVQEIHCMQQEYAQVEVGDISPTTHWDGALRDIDAVVHLAARVHIVKENSTEHLSDFRKVNVGGTVNLALHAADSGVKRFIYLSSIKVNGEGSQTAYTENDTPVPKDAYAMSKWEAEQALHHVAEKTGLPITIIRPPIVYGPGVKANFLSLMKLVKLGLPLPLKGLKNARSMIYIGNLIDAVIRCIDRREAVGQTYLVSDGEDISSPELVRRIAASFKMKPRLIPCPAKLLRFIGKTAGRSEQIEKILGSLTVNMEKIRHELAWRPPYTIDYGLLETAKWFLTERRVQ